MRRMLLTIALLSAIGGPALAVNPDEMLADPALETRARDIGKDLRCLVCQNQSIDDSDASLARDLRVIVRERLQAGDSDRQVMEYVVARYGDFVLLKPPLKVGTYALWFGPLFLLAAGIAAVFAFYRRAASSVAGRMPMPLTTDEEAELSHLFTEDKTP
ncbi:MAG: cytochrome c-type biogenesis protein CcmH [Magnetospirillum sp.]|nr:cytochrome c-type biogenesis protein CcmH [Magnetospirillum sp.]